MLVNTLRLLLPDLSGLGLVVLNVVLAVLHGNLIVSLLVSRGVDRNPLQLLFTFVTDHSHRLKTLRDTRLLEKRLIKFRLERSFPEVVCVYTIVQEVIRGFRNNAILIL